MQRLLSLAKKSGVERPRRHLDIQRLGRFAAWNARSTRSDSVASSAAAAKAGALVDR